MRHTLRLSRLPAFVAGLCLAAIVWSAPGNAAAQADPTPRPPQKDAPRSTDNRVLEGFLRSFAPDFKGQPGHWTLQRDGVEITIVTDEPHDRMRVMAPVGNAKKLEAVDLATLLDANFDRALDAKYATRQGVVWAVYLHPLSPLTKEEFESAVKQVVALRKNYGTTFSSTNLVFASPR